MKTLDSIHELKATTPTNGKHLEDQKSDIIDLSGELAKIIQNKTRLLYQTADSKFTHKNLSDLNPETLMEIAADIKCHCDGTAQKLLECTRLNAIFKSANAEQNSQNKFLQIGTTVVELKPEAQELIDARIQCNKAALAVNYL